jgi:hypothetical protein
MTYQLNTTNLSAKEKGIRSTRTPITSRLTFSQYSTINTLYHNCQILSMSTKHDIAQLGSQKCIVICSDIITYCIISCVIREVTDIIEGKYYCFLYFSKKSPTIPVTNVINPKYNILLP